VTVEDGRLAFIATCDLVALTRGRHTNTVHIVAGSMEGYMLVLNGDWEWWRMIGQFVMPVLLGNIVGGTALFALISYAQVMEEI